jgi:predicted NUDIX family NTP pyrophosphohydrolase
MRESAGILLHRGAGDTLELLLAHPGGPFWAKKDEGAWTIPKGEVDEAEELGEPPELSEEALVGLGSVRQKAKIVHCWAAEGDFDPAAVRSATFTMEWPPRSGMEQEFPEVDRAEWFRPEEARRRLLAAQVPFVDRLLEALA